MTEYYLWQVKMRLKKFLFFAILLAFSTIGALFANADTQAFSGYVYSGNSITVDKQVIFIYLGSDGIVADYGKGFFSIANNTCESTDYFKVCLDNIDYDYTAKKKRISLRAFSTVPYLTITRSVSKSELVIGEEAVFEVSISNSGGIARNATFTDFFPSAFYVYDVNGASLDGNSVVWSGILPRSGTRTIEYKVKPRDAVKQGLKASLSYFDGYADQTIFSSEVVINAVHFLGLETSVGKSSVVLGQQNNFTLNLTNRGNNTVNATLLVTFSPDISVVPATGFVRVKNNVYSWSGDLRKRNLSNNRFFSKAFVFHFTSQKIGASEIIVDPSYYDYSSGDYLSLVQVKRAVEVSDSGISVRSNLNDRILEPDQEFAMKVWIQNLNAYVPMKDVYISTYTDLGYIPDVYLPVLDKGYQKLVIEKNFFAPNTSATSGYALYVNVTYNVSGSNSFKAYKDTLSVTPVKDLVINQLASKTSVESGKTFSFTVSVSNPRTTGINNVRIYDTLPAEFSRYGSMSNVISIPKKESTTAYAYEITAPRVSEEKTFVIRTNVEYSDSDNEYDYFNDLKYNFSKEIKITVLPVKFPLAVTASMADTDLFTGHFHDVNYIIKNPNENWIAEDVVLYLPLQPEFDVVGNMNYSLPDIDPGESVFLSARHKIRPKINDSQTLVKPYFTFRDKYGSSYLYNGSDAILKIKSSPVYGPALILNKNSSDTANNTDKFIVSLSIMNVGKQDADAEVSDGGQEFSVKVPAESEYVRNYTLSFAEAGTYELPAAIAKYSYNGMKLYTASNSKKVSIVSKPVIRIEKSAPLKANNADPIAVSIKVTNLQDITIPVRVVDGSNEWEYDAAPGEKMIFRNVTFDFAGQKALGKAVAFYALGNKTYNVSSNDASVDVSEKTFALLKKSVSRAGEEINVILSLKNEQENALGVEIRDDGRTWFVDLKPGKEENVSYRIKPKDTSLPQANASFLYGEKRYVIYSNQVDLEAVKNETKGEVKKEQGGNFIKNIINALLKVLTFKKSDI